ncbi:MAG: hypothetical protein Q4B57_04130 [Eubacteriales bacterium]|nr:hypothetical protein [Eubacteriales bacterium]
MGAYFIVFGIFVIGGIAWLTERARLQGSGDETPEDIVNSLPPDLREVFKAEWYKPFQRG